MQPPAHEVGVDERLPHDGARKIDVALDPDLVHGAHRTRRARRPLASAKVRTSGRDTPLTDAEVRTFAEAAAQSSASTVRLRARIAAAGSTSTTTASMKSRGTVQSPVASRSTPTTNGPIAARM